MLDRCISKAHVMRHKFKRQLFIKNIASFIKSNFKQRAVEQVDYMKNHLCIQSFCCAKTSLVLAHKQLTWFVLGKFWGKEMRFVNVKNVNDESSKFLVFDFSMEANHAICSLLVYSFEAL